MRKLFKSAGTGVLLLGLFVLGLIMRLPTFWQWILGLVIATVIVLWLLALLMNATSDAVRSARSAWAQVRGMWTPGLPLPSAAHDGDAAGSVYELTCNGQTYHGSSGDFLRWLDRMREHYDEGRLPIGEPGSSLVVEFLPTRDAAFEVEAARIDRDWPSGDLLNRRREGRGR